MIPQHGNQPLLPKERNFEGGDSPAANQHPAKRRKREDHNDTSSVEEQTTENEHRDGIKEEDNMVLDEQPTSDIAPLKPTKWQSTIEKVVKAIVSIRFSQVAAFDTEGKTKNIICLFCIYEGRGHERERKKQDKVCVCIVNDNYSFINYNNKYIYVYI